MWEFTILGRPISQKNSKRVGVSRGKGYMYTPANVKRWHKEAKLQLEAQNKELIAIEKKKDLTVTVTSYMAKGQSIDVDNLSGGPLDALQKAGVISNDYWVKKLITMRDKDWESPRVEIQVCYYDD